MSQYLALTDICTDTDAEVAAEATDFFDSFEQQASSLGYYLHDSMNSPDQGTIRAYFFAALCNSNGLCRWSVKAQDECVQFAFPGVAQQSQPAPFQSHAVHVSALLYRIVEDPL
jgi:hypothetical protein